MATKAERAEIAELGAAVRGHSRRLGSVEKKVDDINDKVTQLSIDVGVLKEVRKISRKTAIRWGGLISLVLAGAAKAAEALGWL